jgi:hypothetical protein
MKRGTAYEIAGNPNDIIATHGRASTGKYCGFITRGEVGRYRTLISTGPFFDTPESADDAMQKVIIAVTEWAEHDLDDPRNLLVNIILTSKEGPVISQVVTAAAAC